MPQLIWSRSALLDIQHCYHFLACNNIDAAQRAIKTIRQALTVLGKQPGIGRPVDGLPTAFREWVIDFGDSGYVVRYHIAAETITILAVRHQKEAGF